MAKATSYNKNVTEAPIGLHNDNDPSKQPRGKHRFALNAVVETKDGKHNSISNELGNIPSDVLPEGFMFLGDEYIQGDTCVVIIHNPETNKDQIGIITRDHKYTTIVDTGLGLKQSNQCEIRFRIRRGNERVIYWVDGLNLPRTFNLDRPQNFYSQTYQNYLRLGGDPNTFIGEKWDVSSFNLIKTYSRIPFFSDVEVLNTGNILPGSYNFAIQLVDEDLNPTEWITTSNTVNIFNDNSGNSYERIRGSRNIQTDSQSWPRANKSIKLSITNLDTSFPYYRIAIIQANGNTGVPIKALVSDLYTTSDSNFIYNGNDSNLSETPLEDILVDNEVIFAPQHIEQLENRLILSNTKGKGINWCEFQKFASKISSDLVTKEVILNTIESEPNVKNAKSTFVFRGYMPGEVYSFGIVYIFSDGTLSPVFHIPGKSLANLTSLMKVYEGTNRYIDVHNCASGQYWGLDSEGDTLVGKKQRHHRFPFRKEVNKPLYTTSNTETVLNKYRLTAVVTLNPAWTPGPPSYPVDGESNPIVIDYTFNYQVSGSPTIVPFNGQLVDTDMGAVITIYDDTLELTQIDAPEYAELDPTSALNTYQTPGNERFLIDFTYESYVASSIINADKSEIFGIEFSNIEKPHQDVIGFYIVRNERTEDDKLILDNAVFGAMTEFEQYKSFGLLMPKQYYTVTDCIFGLGFPANSGKTVDYYSKGAWFFSPEHQFLHKRTEFTNIEVEGVYNETSRELPTIGNLDDNVACNNGGSRGVYIDDVQAGTSYNPDVHKKKDKDDDGFDLLIGYRNVNVNFALDDQLAFPEKKRIFHINAANYQNFEADTFYNVSVDNKIGMYLTDDELSLEMKLKLYNTVTNKSGLVYGALVRENDGLYSNFMTRPYYKEHNNPILFGNNTIVNNLEVFNGDAQISAMNLVSSVFYDMVVAKRDKKNRLWKIIAGAVLVVVGVLLALPSGGASLGLTAAGAATLSAVAIAYGVSLAVSGIKFEQFKKMIDVDYEKGLKETVSDGDTYATIRETIQSSDDTIRWFADRVSNIYIESSVPFGLRSGLTSGITDFVDAPAPYNEEEFRTYLTEKLTVVDRDQGSGRLYKGYATSEVYDMNLDFMRFNKEKQFSHLPIEYDCCSDSNEDFPLRNWYSEQSFQEEKVDNYRVFLPNNYRDIEGEHGEITDTYRLGNSLFIHTKEGLWHLPQNLQERVTGELVSFIGTGDFFSIPPRKVIDDDLGSGGTQHKWATVKTEHGVFFISEIEHNVYLHGQNPKVLSANGTRNWFEENLKSFLVQQLYEKFEVVFPLDNNPASKYGVGYISNYDTRYERVLLTKRDYLILPDKLEELIMVPTKPVTGNDFSYSFDDGKFYLGTEELSFDNVEYFENKSWTISYSFLTETWVSLHSYLPNYYIQGKNSFYSFVVGDQRIWRHNIEGLYQKYYDKAYPLIIELVKLSSPVQDNITEDITIQTQARKWNSIKKQYTDEQYITFTKLLAYNSFQSTGELLMVVKDSKPAAGWFANQTLNNPGEITVSRGKRDWRINDLRDYVIDYSKPLFTSEWADLNGQYFIDKIPNPEVIDHNKPWGDLQSLRDKYMVFRLKFDNFTDINLILNFTLETEQTSFE